MCKAQSVVSGSTLRIGSRHFSQSVFLHVKWPARNLSSDAAVIRNGVAYGRTHDKVRAGRREEVYYRAGCSICGVSCYFVYALSHRELWEELKDTDGKVVSAAKRRYLICENPPRTRAVAFVQSSPTQGKALALAVDPRPRPGVAQRAAIVCCYGYPDRLALNCNGSDEHEWKLRGRRSLSTRERTSFVAVPQTENGRVLSWRADNLPSFTFCHLSKTFEELFHIAFRDWMRSG